MKIGDQVSVLDEDISGEVSNVINGIFTIIDEHGFEYQYSENELVIENNSFSKSEFSPQNISEILSEKQIKKNKNTTRIKPKDRNLPPMEVDLHIHQLTSNTRGMDNFDMLTLQLDTAKRQIEFAFSKKIQRIVFIHGVGEGVLRTELEYLLKHYDNLKFYDADYQKYGVGATEVYIFQNKI
ncbi:MAG: DNA mismatch repair protein MutS [Flavobacterium sp.]|nr:MAG: DNA mismatch repair protein MutS [Flavobacterium sp.]